MLQRALVVLGGFLFVAPQLVTFVKAQQITVGGTVRAAFHVEITGGQAPAACVNFERISPSMVRVRIMAGPDCPVTSAFEIALRTNAPRYELEAREETGQVLTLQWGTPRPSGTDVHPLAPSFWIPSGALCTAGSCMATGTRISLRGSFSSPANALIVPVKIETTRSSGQATLDFILREK